MNPFRALSRAVLFCLCCGLALPILGWACVLVFLLSFLLRGGRHSHAYQCNQAARAGVF